MIIRRLKSEKGALSSILLALFFIIVGVGATVGLSEWGSSVKNSLQATISSNINTTLGLNNVEEEYSTEDEEDESEQEGIAEKQTSSSQEVIIPKPVAGFDVEEKEGSLIVTDTSIATGNKVYLLYRDGFKMADKVIRANSTSNTFTFSDLRSAEYKLILTAFNLDNSQNDRIQRPYTIIRERESEPEIVYPVADFTTEQKENKLIITDASANFGNRIYLLYRNGKMISNKVLRENSTSNTFAFSDLASGEYRVILTVYSSNKRDMDRKEEIYYLE